MALAATKRKLLQRVTCPHCWKTFSPHETLWISEHIDLIGDSRLGPNEQERFLPTRFNSQAQALDAKSFPCHRLACPHCHLEVPRSMLELEPMFLSIFGGPGCGKSYFLAAMTWELRRLMHLDFMINFTDADPTLNAELKNYESNLFANAQSQNVIPLDQLIRKTEVTGEMYDAVTYGTQVVNYPRPFIFSMRLLEEHPNASQKKDGMGICLYDNAGESFQPGEDSTARPVTRHMALSRVLFFVFDPLQDVRFRMMCSGLDDSMDDSKLAAQEPVFQEATARIRRFAGLSESEKHDRPLVVIVAKCDRWLKYLGGDIPDSEPYRKLGTGMHAGQSMESSLAAIDAKLVEKMSSRVRELLLKTTPEIVTAAEGFAKKVIFVPVSALGWNLQNDPKTNRVAIKPNDTTPFWVTVPLIYALHRWSSGMIPGITHQPKPE